MLAIMLYNRISRRNRSVHAVTLRGDNVLKGVDIFKTTIQRMREKYDCPSRDLLETPTYHGAKLILTLATVLGTCTSPENLA